MTSKLHVVSQSEFFCHAANRFSLRQRGLGFEAYPEKLLRVNVGARILCFGARTLFILARFLHAETRLTEMAHLLLALLLPALLLPRFAKMTKLAVVATVAASLVDESAWFA